MKKSLSLLLLCVLTLSFAACGKVPTVDYYGAELTEDVPGLPLVGGELPGLSDGKALPLSQDSADGEITAALFSGLFNIDRNETVFQERITDKMYPASMTKLMTLLLVFEKIGDTSARQLITGEVFSDLSSDSSLAYLEEGATYTVEDLLYGLMLPSGNDAANALAIAVSGSVKDFVALMNDRARSLGMLNTHFMNAHGLHHDNHYTTVYDLYLLVKELLTHNRFLDIISTEYHTACAYLPDGTAVSHDYTNTNSYVRKFVQPPKGVVCYGGKTGTTNAAGRCLLMVAVGPGGDFYVACVGKSNGYDQLYQDMNAVLGKIQPYEDALK